MTATVLDTKTKEVDNIIPDLRSLVKETHYDAKVSEIEGKYFTTSDYNKLSSDILDAKIKLTKLTTKAELKLAQDKIEKLQAFDSCYFHGKKIFGDDGFQNMSVCQPTIKRQRHQLCYWLNMKRFI